MNDGYLGVNGANMMIIDESKRCKVGVYEYVLSLRLPHDLHVM